MKFYFLKLAIIYSILSNFFLVTHCFANNTAENFDLKTFFSNPISIQIEILSYKDFFFLNSLNQTNKAFHKFFTEDQYEKAFFKNKSIEHARLKGFYHLFQTINKSSSNYKSYISYDEKILALYQHDHTIDLWDLESGNLIKTLKGHESWINSIHFSPDRKTLASGSSDETIKIWDIESGECIKTLKGHTGVISIVHFSPDKSTFASVSYDNSIKIWDLKTDECIYTLKNHHDKVNIIDFSPDGTLLASGTENNTIKIWDIKSGQCIKTFNLHNCSVELIHFSGNGKKLASYSSTGINILDMDSGQSIRFRENINGSISSLHLSPNGEILTTILKNNNIIIWNAKLGKMIKDFKWNEMTFHCGTFSPQGNTIALGDSNDAIKILKLAPLIPKETDEDTNQE